CIILGPLVALKGLFLWKKCFNCYRGGLGWGGHFVAYEDIEMVRATIRSGPHKIVRDCKFLFQGSNSDGPFTFKINWCERDAQSPNVDYLIQTVSAPIIQRMKADIDRCGTARWGEHAIFGKDSIT